MLFGVDPRHAKMDFWKYADIVAPDQPASPRRLIRHLQYPQLRKEGIIDLYADSVTLRPDCDIAYDYVCEITVDV